jgi:broad specificity phosphatase PhoE
MTPRGPSSPASQDPTSLEVPSKQSVVVVRHGETEWSVALRHTGRTDVALTEAGERDARALGECLGEWTFARVLVSPLQRARDTARLAGFGGTAHPRPDLMEWDYGEYEGRTTAEIRTERPDWLLWRDGVPDGESVEHVGERADRVLEEVRTVEGDVALFAHGHVLRILAARWLGLPPDRGRSLALGTGTIGVLGYERETPVLLRWNAPCALSPGRR